MMDNVSTSCVHPACMEVRKRMMQTLCKTILTVLLLSPSVVAQRTEAAETLLQTAIKKETVDGDLSAAIAGYKKALAAAKGNRTVAATALVRMAGCYQKSGDREARKLYEQVVREYSDQTEALTIARTKLGTAVQAAGLVYRQVWTGPKVDIWGAVSPDERYLSFVDWYGGNLLLRDLTTGKDRALTANSFRDTSEFPGASIFSPDSKQIAFLWISRNHQRSELRIMPLTEAGASASRTVLSNAGGILPLDWSPDGKWILMERFRSITTAQLVLLSVVDGSQKPLMDLDQAASNARFSPDGSLIAYNSAVRGDKKQRDIYILSTSGGKPAVVAAHPGDDAPLSWTPDGTSLLFTSDRSGVMGIWSQPFRDHQPFGEAALVKPDIGRSRSLGMSRKGTVYLGQASAHPDIFTASVDFRTGTVTSAPVPALGSSGSNTQADWSWDGEEMVFKVERSTSPLLAVRSAKTGRTREVSPTLAMVNHPRWSPDGKFFIVQGTGLKGQGIYRVDSGTGETSLVALSGFAPIVLPGGRAILFRRNTPTKHLMIQRDLDSQSDREVFSVNELGWWPTVSPDGSTAANILIDQSTKESVLFTIPIAGGSPKLLLRSPDPKRLITMAWTADGTAVIVQKTTAPSASSEYWIVPVSGEPPYPLHLGFNDMNFLRVHPDGKRILFAAAHGGNEIWALENIVQTLKTRK